jgi:hypothetical protein
VANGKPGEALSFEPALEGITRGCKTSNSLAAAEDLHGSAGLPAMAEASYAGAPIDFTLSFSREQLRETAEAFPRGDEWRIDAGLHDAESQRLQIAASDQVIRGGCKAAQRGRVSKLRTGNTIAPLKHAGVEEPESERLHQSIAKGIKLCSLE